MDVQKSLVYIPLGSKGRSELILLCFLLNMCININSREYIRNLFFIRHCQHHTRISKFVLCGCYGNAWFHSFAAPNYSIFQILRSLNLVKLSEKLTKTCGIMSTSGWKIILLSILGKRTYRTDFINFLTSSMTKRRRLYFKNISLKLADIFCIKSGIGFQVLIWVSWKLDIPLSSDFNY